MASVTALEAKTRFGQLLERVARGEEVISVVVPSLWFLEIANGLLLVEEGGPIKEIIG